VLCTRCGLVLLDGFKFCHHCGTGVNIAAAAPELARPVPEEEPLLPIEPIIPAEDAAEEAEEPEAGPGLAEGDVSAGRMFILELLCYIPLLNVILLAAISAAGRRTPMREIARGKLLAMMTATLVFLFAALIIILLMYIDVIQPIYLGRWRG
jgi:hypothetical protein